jgi:hypothetical protein
VVRVVGVGGCCWDTGSGVRSMEVMLSARHHVPKSPATVNDEALQEHGPPHPGRNHREVS